MSSHASLGKNDRFFLLNQSNGKTLRLLMMSNYCGRNCLVSEKIATDTCRELLNIFSNYRCFARIYTTSSTPLQAMDTFNDVDMQCKIIWAHQDSLWRWWQPVCEICGCFDSGLVISPSDAFGAHFCKWRDLGNTVKCLGNGKVDGMWNNAYIICIGDMVFEDSYVHNTGPSTSKTELFVYMFILSN